ncbi:transposase [Sporosarcina sp. FSL K6-1522]|uniref:transposase n=1 Tax=Sporosarcina sp. FSL K6-1522 TaxID=2921554 RepID=UPI003159A66C
MMNEKKRKRQLSFEQKLYAVQEVLEKGRHKKDVASELDIHINSITNWMKIYREKGENGLRPTPKAILLDEATELERLKKIEKKYNEQLVEIEILKKFHAFLKESEK